MKNLCIAVMLLISTTLMSQITVTKYNSIHTGLTEISYDVETTYSFKNNELALKVRSLATDTTTTIYYRILEVIRSTNNIGWICYKCMDGKGNYINYTFFFDGKNVVMVEYESGNYSITEGDGLVY